MEFAVEMHHIRTQEEAIANLSRRITQAERYFQLMKGKTCEADLQAIYDQICEMKHLELRMEDYLYQLYLHHFNE